MPYKIYIVSRNPRWRRCSKSW